MSRPILQLLLACCLAASVAGVLALALDLGLGAALLTAVSAVAVASIYTALSTVE